MEWLTLTTETLEMPHDVSYRAKIQLIDGYKNGGLPTELGIPLI